MMQGGVDTEVAEELAFHVEMRTRELVAKGWTVDAARAEVLRGFGDIERVRRACASLGRVRNRRMTMRVLMHDIAADVRYALRQLRAAPGFTSAAVLTLALGVGGTTAIFSVVNAVILRPFDFAEPERVVTVWEAWRDGASAADVSAGNFVDWQDMSDVFEHMAALSWRSFNLATDDAPERVLGVEASHEFFDVLGVRPVLGRGFLPEEDAPGSEQVVVLSHELWAERFDGDRAVVGREVRINSLPYTVVGVMPPGFDPFTNDEKLWVPIAFTPERRQMHDEHYLTVVARLRRGVTREQAQSQMSGIGKVLQERFPKDNAERGVRVMPFGEAVITDDLRTRLFIMLGAVGLVLLIACGNVANLLLARGAGRERELGVRAAIGAAKSRLVRQLLTESVVLALIAAVLGAGIAYAGVRVLIVAAPPGVPRLETAAVDGVALGFTILVSAISGILFGLAPALRVARHDLFGALREGGRGTVGPSHDRLRGAFVAAEVALAFTLLAGASLLVRSALLLGRANVGLEPAGVLTGRVTLPPSAYGEGEDARRTFTQMAELLEQAGGVAAAALSSQVPAGPGGGSNGLVPEGRPIAVESAINTRLRIITPGYFDALGIRIEQGRAFNEADVAGRMRVMIISRQLADQAWPGEDPIGKRMLCCEGSPEDPMWKTVVGVAADVQWRGPGQAYSPEFYLPLAQAPSVAFSWISSTMTLVARSATGQPESVADALRAAVHEVQPDVPLFDVTTMEDRLRATFATSRFNASLLAVLGIVGLLLAVIGIYGVVAYHASRRVHEIGLRMALGASARDVLALVTGQGLRPVLIGLALGGMGALAATQVLRSALYGVTPTDPITFVGAGAAMLLAAFAAAFLPAQRATRIDPGRVLTRG
jgi:predicted permease